MDYTTHHAIVTRPGKYMSLNNFDIYTCWVYEPDNKGPKYNKIRFMNLAAYHAAKIIKKGTVIDFIPLSTDQREYINTETNTPVPYLEYSLYEHSLTTH